MEFVVRSKGFSPITLTTRAAACRSCLILSIFIWRGYRTTTPPTPIPEFVLVLSSLSVQLCPNQALPDNENF